MTHDIDKSTTPSALGFVPGLGEMGSKQLQAATEMQKAFLDAMEDLNRTWLRALGPMGRPGIRATAGKLVTVSIRDVLPRDRVHAGRSHHHRQ